MTDASAADQTGVMLVVDVANVVGSRPDGWWRDRVGASQRLLTRLAALPGALVSPPAAHLDPGGGLPVRVERLVAVVEGQAKGVQDVEGLQVVRAVRDGDSAIVEVSRSAVAAGRNVVVVTADRGLRARLTGVTCVGPRWLLENIHDPQTEVP